MSSLVLPCLCFILHFLTLLKWTSVRACRSRKSSTTTTRSSGHWPSRQKNTSATVRQSLVKLYVLCLGPARSTVMQNNAEQCRTMQNNARTCIYLYTSPIHLYKSLFISIHLCTSVYISIHLYTVYIVHTVYRV